MAKSSRTKAKPEVTKEDEALTAKAVEQADADFAEAELAKAEVEEAAATQEKADDKNKGDTKSETPDEGTAEVRGDVEPAAEEATTEDTAEDVAEEAAEAPEEEVVTALREGNYLNQPKELRDAQASQEQIHTPTGTRLTPPMNPFMKMEQERESKRVKSNVPTAADMVAKVATELKIDTSADFVLGSVVAKLDNYITAMAPNTPVTPELGARWQGELAKCFFEALGAAPEASLAALRIIELYFTTYSNHTMARSHVFRFMDTIRLEQQRLIGFQSLLHLFVELGDRGDRTNKEIQREVNIGKIADAVSDNTDAQIRLVEFLN